MHKTKSTIMIDQSMFIAQKDVMISRAAPLIILNPRFMLRSFSVARRFEISLPDDYEFEFVSFTGSMGRPKKDLRLIVKERQHSV